MFHTKKFYQGVFLVLEGCNRVAVNAQNTPWYVTFGLHREGNLYIDCHRNDIQVD